MGGHHWMARIGLRWCDESIKDSVWFWNPSLVNHRHISIFDHGRNNLPNTNFILLPREKRSNVGHQWVDVGLWQIVCNKFRENERTHLTNADEIVSCGGGICTHADSIDSTTTSVNLPAGYSRDQGHWLQRTTHTVISCMLCACVGQEAVSTQVLSSPSIWQIDLQMYEAKFQHWIMHVCDQLIIHWQGTTDPQVGSSHANIMPWRQPLHGGGPAMRWINLRHWTTYFSQNFCITAGCCRNNRF